LPPILAVPTAYLAGLHAGAADGTAVSVIGLLVLGCVFPTLLTVVLVRMGRLSALDLNERADRLVPSMATAFGCAFAWSGLTLSGAPHSISQLALGISIQMAVLALLTTRWKVSYHAASASGLVVVSHSLGNVGLTFGLLLLAVAIGWSRIHRRRHTLAQVAIGALTAAPIALLT
jgi:hypothetical protein